jgi:hypothetical protein
MLLPSTKTATVTTPDSHLLPVLPSGHLHTVSDDPVHSLTFSPLPQSLQPRHPVPLYHCPERHLHDTAPASELTHVASAPQFSTSCALGHWHWQLLIALAADVRVQAVPRSREPSRNTYKSLSSPPYCDLRVMSRACIPLFSQTAPLPVAYPGHLGAMLFKMPSLEASSTSLENALTLKPPPTSPARLHVTLVFVSVSASSANRPPPDCRQTATKHSLAGRYILSFIVQAKHTNSSQKEARHSSLCQGPHTPVTAWLSLTVESLTEIEVDNPATAPPLPCATLPVRVLCVTVKPAPSPERNTAPPSCKCASWP